MHPCHSPLREPVARSKAAMWWAISDDSGHLPLFPPVILTSMRSSCSHTASSAARRDSGRCGGAAHLHSSLAVALFSRTWTRRPTQQLPNTTGEETLLKQANVALNQPFARSIAQLRTACSVYRVRLRSAPLYCPQYRQLLRCTSALGDVALRSALREECMYCALGHCFVRPSLTHRRPRRHSHGPSLPPHIWLTSHTHTHPPTHTHTHIHRAVRRHDGVTRRLSSRRERPTAVSEDVRSDVCGAGWHPSLPGPRGATPPPHTGRG
jgi:hypothetical protein